MGLGFRVYGVLIKLLFRACIVTLWSEPGNVVLCRAAENGFLQSLQKEPPMSPLSAHKEMRQSSAWIQDHPIR